MARDIVKMTEKGRAIVELQVNRGRALVKQIPEPVQVQLGKMSKRSVILTLEVFAGLFVVGMVALALAYGRLNQGPVSLASLVPVMEEAINGELEELTVRIDDAIIQRDTDGPGVNFRLRNIRLIDPQGAVVARAPLAAIGLSGKALLRGKIAPGSVDFIGPRLLLFYSAEDGLSMTFSRDETDQAQGKPLATLPATGSGSPNPGAQKDINLTRTITSAFDQVRRKKSASSFLTRFGVRNAVVVFDQLGQQSFWRVPDFAIDMEHQKRKSFISGQGAIATNDGPWSFNFQSSQSTQQDSLAFTAIIRDLVPSSLAAKFPAFPVLKQLNLPVSAETSIELSATGELKGASATLDLAKGHIALPWDEKRPVYLDAGKLQVRYDAQSRQLQILPSRLSWGRSYATLSGSFAPVEGAQGDAVETWQFNLKADDALFEADEFGLAPMKVKRWTAQGTVDKAAKRIVLQKFVLELPEGLIEFAGSVVDAPGSPKVQVAGNISPMPVSVLKQMWPKFIAGGAREWVGERVLAGQVTGGSFEIDMSAGELAALTTTDSIRDASLIADLTATGLEIDYLPGMPSLQTGDVTFEIRGQKVAFDVPDGWVVLPSGKQVFVTKGRFTVDDIRPDPQTGVISFETKGPALPALELLDHAPLEYVRQAGLKPDDLSGKMAGKFQLAMPLKTDLEFDEITLRGATTVTRVKSNRPFGPASVKNGTIDIQVTEKALEAKGKINVNGVPADLTWQRIFDAPGDKQPDLRLSAVLNQSERESVGLDLEHMVTGPVPTIVSVQQVPSKGRARRVAIQADLERTELVFANVGWKKQPGKAAVLGFEIGSGATGNTELQNFRIVGDDIAIDGWISLGDDEKPNAFYFPDFSFNVITHLEVKGKRGNDGIWQITANGPTYDGRQLFRSLFSAGKLAEDQQPAPSDFKGIDLTARVGTVVGFFDTTASDVTVILSKRGGHMTQLDARGTLRGNSGIAARLIEADQNSRTIVAESEDAGSAFKLIGFYPNMEGGQTSLKVTLDTGGSASKQGTLWARDFNVLGDKVVTEVVSNAGDDFGTLIDEPGQPRRQRIAFNELEVPFSVGSGQFTLHDSFINGPQLGATIRGSVDYKTNTVNLDGTYIPLYGLNSIAGSIPVIGNILVGRRGEGVVGIKYSVKGPAGDPKVLINPLSIVTPGIFRQLFDSGRSPGRPSGATISRPSVSPFDPGLAADSN